MKTILGITILFLVVTAGQAQTNSLTGLLQQGLFEEQANRNLDAAITDYQTLAAQFDQDRQLAATAVFRLGECYRAQGRTNEAAAQYERIIRDFNDQQTLVTLSRQDLAGMGLADVRTQLASLRAKELSELSTSTAPASDATLDASSDEDREIQRIQEMIQNSPDLINATRVNGTTPLNNAAQAGQLKVAQYLLDHGADVNLAASSGLGWSPLHFAAGAGNRAMVELLLKHGANIDARANDRETPLCVAVENGFQAVTEVLLNNKAEVDLPDNWGKTPLDVAAEADRLKLVQTLLAAGAQVNGQSNAGRTPLSFAAERGSWDVTTNLLAAGAELNAGTMDAPLLYAIYQINDAAVEWLLKTGANPNAADLEDFTGDFYVQRHVAPLWLAVHRNYLPGVQLLLKFKADPNDTRTDGQSMLFNALENTNILEALLEAGANANAVASDGRTPLDLAVGERNLVAVQLLLKFKADPDSPQNGKRSLLFTALTETNILEALLDAGAEVDPITDDEAGWTPLANAANANNPVATEILLQHGANPNVHNRNGATPLHWAAYQCVDSNIFELLLDAKADPNVRSSNGRTPLDELKVTLQDHSSWPSRFASYEAKAARVEMLIALLHEHGALDKLPDWDAITVSRPAAKIEFAVFHKDTNNWNHFTLFDALANVYLSGQSYQVRQGNSFWRVSFNSTLPFSDLAHVTLVRPSHDSTNETRIAINVLNSTNEIDRSKDMPLEFGDVLEIPERDHVLGDTATGLTDTQRSALNDYVKGKVRLVVQNQQVEIPIYDLDGQANLDTVLNNSEAQKLLRASSDLGHVKVIRHDVKMNEPHEWIFDCRSPQNHDGVPGQPLAYQWNLDGDIPPSPPNSFWLRDGDVIEVPEKP